MKHDQHFQTLEYNNQTFLPCEPHKTVEAKYLKALEFEGPYLVQRNFIGEKVIIKFTPEQISIFFNSKHYKADGNLQACLTQWQECLGNDKTHIIEGVVLSIKFKHVFLATDIFVFNNEHFVGTSYLERYALLSDLMGEPDSHEDSTGEKMAKKFTNNLWLVENFYFNFSNIFKMNHNNTLTNGLLLRDMQKELVLTSQNNHDNNWLILCSNK